MMEQVLAAENVREAWRRVKANAGAPGIDGMTVGAFPAFVHDFLHEHYAAQPCPSWVRDALQSVGITVDLPVVDTGDRGGAE